ncbi:CapA family protein [Candidatus Nitronereus thalassa]|uniref:CapA family protein n=1 Tax=Candidatus Nitronereus thalassa TaxID=3020898 RepID=A0ABU3K592_9BACT|nr:CapA family protein [Candidatus Nitronereus thalassa]MDT7041560.1 CapA family protein [Candidatus Nitronereus thalassa]
MKTEVPCQFHIVKGNTISTNVPPDVPAWQIMHRRPAGSMVSLCAVGDIGLSGRAAMTATRDGGDVLFSEVTPLFQDSDIVFGNLESPLVKDSLSTKMFAAPLMGAELLQRAGFSLMHLANNHVSEYGQEGLSKTLHAVCSKGLVPLGAGDDAKMAKQLKRTDVGGLRIGWLGCGRTLLPQNESGPQYWEFEENELLAAIEESRSQVDLLIVSIHIGMMYIDYPSPDHKAMAEQLMGRGADLILMHHAHILQGVEVTSTNRVACYNLGNFLYDWQEGNVMTPVMLREQNEGAVFYIGLDQQGVAQVAALPTWIDENCRVRWATGDRGYQILNRLHRISEDLKGNFGVEFERQRASRNTGGILKVLLFHLLRGNWGYVVGSLRKARFEHFKMIGGWVWSLGGSSK